MLNKVLFLSFREAAYTSTGQNLFKNHMTP